MAATAPLNTDHELLRQTLGAEGLEFLGVAQATAEGTTLASERYHQWLAQGRHGTMGFLERHAAGKYDPSFALGGTASVIVVGLGYHQARPETPHGYGLVARYAWGRDYHKVVLAKLQRVVVQLEGAFPGARWRAFTDTAPLDERFWAQKTGATFTARNTLAINHTLGSWFVLGEILTTHPFEATKADPRAHRGCPSGCRRCVQVCPTGALEGGTIDARRCLAYLTIEHVGVIADEFKAALGPWLFGCDLCQEVCPFNLGASATGEGQFKAWKAGPHLDLAEILTLDGPRFTARFGGSPVHRTGRHGLVRNACLVAANTGQVALRPILEGLTGDADAGVADAARWALRQWEATR